MTDDGRVERLLSERPDLEAPLRDLLDIDETQTTWTFDDVPLDSGTFGELVSREIVEKTESGEYRLADSEAVRLALDDELSVETTSSSETLVSTVDVPLPDIDYQAAGLLGGALALVVVVRSFVVASVFRGEHVVLSGNDPYYYRFWVEELLATGGSLTQLTAEILQYEGGIVNEEPLMVALLATVSKSVGGVESAGAVLAIYPVVAAVVVGVLLYWMAVHLTGDRRIGLVSVVFLAIMPSTALRTALGFADHHAFDYVWVTVVAAALVALIAVTNRDELSNVGVWMGTLGLGIGIGALTLGWDSGPLMFVPVAVVVGVVVLLDVRTGRSPLLANGPIAVGLGVAALLSYLGHTTFGWQGPYVTASPALLFGGTVYVVLLGELAFRLDRSMLELAVVEVAGVLVGFRTLLWQFPEFESRLRAGIMRIIQTDDIVEANPLFGGDTLQFLLLFGFVLFLAVPALAWTSRRAFEETEWLVPCSFGWYFFTLSLFQVRFTGQLGIFTALFASIATVWLAARIDLTPTSTLFDGDTDRDFSTWTPGRPDMSTLGTVFLFFVLVGGLAAMQSAINVQQVTTDDADYETAAWLGEYAAQQGWDSRSESYIFTKWGKNRMYNYFVNGESRSYSYAQSNYESFIATSDPDEAIAMVDGRVRFIVTQRADSPRGVMHSRLHHDHGSRNEDIEGLGRFRAVFSTPDGSRKAFVLVPGATIHGTAEPNSSVSVATDVDIPGTSFTYKRQAPTNATGGFNVTVAYPGTYTITQAADEISVTVPEQSVMNGTRVDAP